MPTFLRVVREGEHEHALARELRETREATNATKFEVPASIWREPRAKVKVSHTKTTPGFIYFIQQGETPGPIKIGWAKDPQRRLGELQIGGPARLRILGTRPGTIKDETALHRRFERQALSGEWFRWSLELQIEARR